MSDLPGATPLCVMLPEIGLASETFLRWDIEQILPARTTVIADPPPGGRSITGDTVWRLDGRPSLVFTPQPGDPPPDADRIRHVADFLAHHQVEAVLVEYLDFADRWYDLLRTLGPRIYLRAHGADVSARLNEPRYNDAYRRFHDADGIIVPSRHAAQRLTADAGLPSHLLHWVGHPVQVPARIHDHGDQAACVAVGRLVAKKGTLHTLEAFWLAAAENPGLTLDLIGDGPQATDIRRYIDDHHLTGRVRLHGQLNHQQTLAMIRGSDLLLHHAVTAPEDGDSEGQPLVILEAMAAGLAVITTRHAGIPELITDGITGRLVDEHDTLAMADVLTGLAQQPAHRAALGGSARAHILAHHTPVRARRHLQQLLGLSAGDR